MKLYRVDALPFDTIKARLVKASQKAVQDMLDQFARTRHYDGILSLCTYATSADPKFAAEGQRGVDLRDQAWAKCYAVMSEVEAGQRTIPTVDELMAEMPEMVWTA